MDWTRSFTAYRERLTPKTLNIKTKRLLNYLNINLRFLKNVLVRGLVDSKELVLFFIAREEKQCFPLKNSVMNENLKPVEVIIN